jgi:hypothetical protein
MRHGTAGRRTRNRGNGGRRGNQNRAQVFDSNGPEVRIRGTAHQICEKYLALAKDSAASGDQVLAESYLQHAEHYQRVINGWEDTLYESADTRAERSEKDEHKTNSHQNSEKKAEKPKKEEDLGLPESIVGKKVEKTLENV